MEVNIQGNREVAIRVDSVTEHLLLCSASVSPNPALVFRGAKLTIKVSRGILSGDEIEYPHTIPVSTRQASRLGKRLLEVASSSCHRQNGTSVDVYDMTQPLISWYVNSRLGVNTDENNRHH